MPDPQTLLLFSLAALALGVTPGPDMILIATRSAGQGRLAGLATYLGISAGAMTHAAAMALGLSQLFEVVPLAYDLLRYAGAAYLLFLAWQALRGGGAARGPAAPVRRHGAWRLFRQGYVTNVLNPKVALFFLALLPQFLDPAAGPVGLQIMVLALVLCIVSFGPNGIVILVSARAGRAAAGTGRLARLGRYLTALVFTGLAARLVADPGR